MLQKIRWFSFLLGVLVVVVVAFQNHNAVELDLLFFRGEYPLTLLLLGTSAISFVLGALMTAWRMRSKPSPKESKASKKQKAVKNEAPADSKTPVESPLPGVVDPSTTSRS
ncbi:MAG: LapA family protein [Planctomycetota bacterium]